MPYNITKFNGVKVATVEDGTVDNTLDIKLVGKNYAGYGEIQNENMVHMLENFAGTTPPPRRISGQLWYDSLGKKLKFYDGDKFRTTGGAEIGATPPAGLAIGDFWFKQSTNQLFAFDGTDFKLIGPQAVEGAASTELSSVAVTDINGISRAIVQAKVNGNIVFIISNNEFTIPDTNSLASGGALALFPGGLIKKGITLARTRNTDGISQDQFIYFGTASSALGLVDSNGNLVTAGNLVRTGNAVFSSLVKFEDPGYVLGTDNDIKFYIDNSTNNPTLENLISGSAIVFKTKTGTAVKTPMKLIGSSIVPGEADQYDIGAINNEYNNVYANNFVGRATVSTVADSMPVAGLSGVSYSATIAADANSIAARDNQGKITAAGFIGLATQSSNLFGGGAGDIPYQTSPNVTAFLNKGAAGSVLTVNNSNNLAWQTFSSLLPSSFDASKLSVEQETDAGNYYLTFVDGNSGFQTFKVHSPNLSYNPTTSTLTTAFFDGLSTSAKYADLAEKYLADKEYEVGTVLIVGGEKEVTASTPGTRAIGVVSAYPAYLMNKDLEHGTIVALKGRVPVKVEGMIIKGQKLMAGSNGSAIHDMYNSSNTFAIALESSNQVGIKLIEAVIL